MPKAIFAAMFAVAAAISAPASAAPPAAAPASSSDDILNKLINVPVVTGWRIDGLQAKPAVRKDPAVQGGKALRVEIPGKGEHPWSVSAADAIDKPVKAGDKIVLAFWARLEKGENGATSATLPSNSVQLAAEPYTALFSGPATIGPDWKMYEVHGTADRDYPAGKLGVALHLATAKQVIDLGPVFVLDMGQ